MKSIKPGRGPSQMGMAIYAAVYNHHNATSKDRYPFLILLMKTKRQIRLMKGMEKNCRINLENKVHKKITKILALAIDKC